MLLTFLRASLAAACASIAVHAVAQDDAATRKLAETCAACHGPEGKGNEALGAPNLTDKVWLHGFGEEAIVRMVTNGKVNVMPAQASRLSPEQIRVLAAYVMSLSQGVATAAAK